MSDDDLSMNQQRVLMVLQRMTDEVANDEGFADYLVESMDAVLDEYHSMDGFGTEGSSDPRGDFRDGKWAMDFVQSVDRA